MFGEEITIDIDKLRKDMRDECLAGFLGGGIGGMLIEASDIDRATPEELVRMAQRNGINLYKYRV